MNLIILLYKSSEFIDNQSKLVSAMQNCSTEWSDRARKTKKILDTIDEACQSLRRHEKVAYDNFNQRISLNRGQDRTQHIFDNLAQKYLVIKHSHSTKQPHQKYLYISDDRRFLCWKSLNKEDEKIMQLNKINLILKDKQLSSHKKSATMVSDAKNCFIVVSELRNLEIECKNDEEAQKIITELEQAIKNSRRMHLNYQY